MIRLSELQESTILEILNLGIGRAAASLSEMTREEVFLSIPKMQIVRREEVRGCLGEGEETELVAVKQEFAGPFSGDALLFFPEDRSLELVRTVLGDEIPVDAMSEFEEEALLEVGNVLLNACLSSFADTFDYELNTSLPTCHRGRCDRILENGTDSESDRVLFIGIDFVLKGRAITGYVVFILSMQSIHALRDQVDGYLERMGIRVE